MAKSVEKEKRADGEKSPSPEAMFERGTMFVPGSRQEGEFVFEEVATGEEKESGEDQHDENASKSASDTDKDVGVTRGESNKEGGEGGERGPKEMLIFEQSGIVGVWCEGADGAELLQVVAKI